MKSAKRSMKLINELMNFYFSSGINSIKIIVEHNEEETEICIRGEKEGISLKQLEELEVLLNTPREKQVEEYYWELAGENNQVQELSLVGMMTDKVEVYYHENELMIKAFRKE